MNLFANIPSIVEPDEETAEVVDEKAEKKARIDFHRRMVRNGPANFRGVTNGQVRREKQRALRRHTRKTRARQLQDFHASQQALANLRAHLQAAGVLARANEESLPPISERRALQSVTWIVKHFVDSEQADDDGRVTLTDDVVRQALQNALNHWQTSLRLPVTPLSPAYKLPVRLAA